MTTLSKVQELLEHGKAQEAWIEFNAFASNSVKGRLHASKVETQHLQIAQKLGVELFKREDFIASKSVCDIVISWTTSSENEAPASLDDAFELKHKSKVNRANLAKTEIWARLTALQAMARMDDTNDRHFYQAATTIIERLKTSGSQKLLENSVLQSTSRKVRSLLCSMKNLEIRLLSFTASNVLGIEWGEDMDRFVSILLRDMRASNFYTKEVEMDLEKILTEDKPRLCFDFGSWLLHSCPKKRSKALLLLCENARLMKEALFAAQQILSGNAERDVATSALDALYRCFLLELREDAINDLTRVHAKIWVQFELNDSPLLIERIMNAQSLSKTTQMALGEKELEAFLRLKQLDAIVERLSGVYEHSLNEYCHFWFAKAVLIRGDKERALSLILNHATSDCFNLVVLRAGIKAELNMDCYDDVQLLVKNQEQLSHQILREACYFAWNMGFYMEAAAFGRRLTTDDDIVIKSEIEERLGSDAARIIHECGDDPDACVRIVAGELAKISAPSLMTEFEDTYKLIMKFISLADVLRERGSYRLCRYFTKKARFIARSKGLKGLLTLIDERIELLEHLRSSKHFRTDGSNENLLDNDEEETIAMDFRSKSADAFAAFLGELHQRKMGRANGVIKEALQNFLRLAGIDGAPYHACLDALHIRQDLALFESLSIAMQFLPSDSLKAEALLAKINAGEKVSEADIRRGCEDNPPADLVVLRDLYLNLLRSKHLSHGKLPSFVSTDREDAYLVSSLVGLSLRAQRAQVMTAKGTNMSDENFDLFHCHRIKMIKDAASVQRAQISARLSEPLAVCTLVYDDKSSSMLLCRSERDGDVTLGWQVDAEKARSVLERFAAIMQRNLEQTVGSTPEVATSIDGSSKARWWDSRFDLEQELKDWLAEFEGVFLGWRAAFIKGKPAGKASDAKKVEQKHGEDVEETEVSRGSQKSTATGSRRLGKVQTTAKKPSKGGLGTVFAPDAVLEADEGKQAKAKPVASKRKSTRKRVVESSDDEEDGSLKPSLSLAEREKEDDELADSFSRAMDLRGGRKIRFDDAAEDSRKSISTANTADPLVRICLESGLGDADIAQALEEACGISRESARALAATAANSVEPERHPVVLCLSGALQQLPLECIPSLDGRPVSRVASLPFALETRSSARATPKAFIVNPERNLKRTEDTMKARLGPWRDAGQWTGVFGSEVKDKEETSRKLRTYLTESSLLLYCGHGAGEEFLDRDSIAKLEAEVCPTLLMGCSSAQRRDMGVFEPNGVVDSYVLAGCPLVVGNLWNVTDKDIDRFTLAILDAMEERGSAELVSLVAKARKACKLLCLVGAAPVCFGLPCVV